MSDSMLNASFAVAGTFIHSTMTAPMVILRDHCIGVTSGKIVFIEKKDDRLTDVLQKYDIEVDNVIHLGELQFVVPGFVDSHIHASQYSNCGKYLDEDMLSWLHRYTFPTEAKFADPDFATTQYWKVVSRVIKNGTTTASYYATIHASSTLKLCDIIHSIGQRAIVGKVNMDQNCPGNYREDTTSSVQDTLQYVKEVESRKYTHIKPAITPRYAGNCSLDLMKRLGHIANSHKLHVQTHIAETKDECQMVRTLFPESRSYTGIYDEAGLLTQKTVLAHGIYLSPDERKLISLRHSSISHCPNSNISIRSGLMDVRTYLDDNISVGLGTDISSGYNASMLNAMRAAICTSNTIALQKGPNYKPLDYQEVFKLATIGGAKELDVYLDVTKIYIAGVVDEAEDAYSYGTPVLDMEDVIGNFEIGKEFDALVVDPNIKGGPIDIFEDDTIEDAFQKFIFLGDDRNILKVFVAGNDILENLHRKEY